jgi:hypothetical protein
LAAALGGLHRAQELDTTLEVHTKAAAAAAQERHITGATGPRPPEAVELQNGVAAALLVFHPPTTMQLRVQMVFCLGWAAAAAAVLSLSELAATAATAASLLVAGAAAMAEAPYQVAAALVATDSAVFTLGKDKT